MWMVEMPRLGSQYRLSHRLTFWLTYFPADKISCDWKWNLVLYLLTSTLRSIVKSNWDLTLGYTLRVEMSRSGSQLTLYLGTRLVHPFRHYSLRVLDGLACMRHVIQTIRPRTRAVSEWIRRSEVQLWTGKRPCGIDLEVWISISALWLRLYVSTCAPLRLYLIA